MARSGFFGGLICCAALFAACAGSADEKTLFLYVKASAAYERGNFEEAADIASEAGNFAPALVLRGKALYFRGDAAGAEAALRQALRRNPASAEAPLFLARLLRDQGRDGDARVLAEALLRDNPQDIRALRLASDLAAVRGDGESAAALLDRAAEASSETALVFIDRAKLRWTGGNREGALEDLSRAEALLPRNSYLSKTIGEIRFLIRANSYRGEEADK
jgi:tetratricopeptide (TPR) repeat protein